MPKIALNRSVNLGDIIDTRALKEFGTGHQLKVITGSASDNVDLSSSSNNGLQSPAVSRGLEQLSETIESTRKLLTRRSPLQRSAIAELDQFCESLAPSLQEMSVPEKIKLSCAFGQLREFSVVNRVADRYNYKPLLYVNRSFYTALVKSIDWTSLYASTSAHTRSLSVVLQVVRSVNRMSLDKQSISTVLNGVLTELTHYPKIGTSQQLTELIMIASKNRLVHASFFDRVISDLSSNHNMYSEDLIGDLARSLTTLGFYSDKFHDVLTRELPLVSHELSWWNLIDLATYYKSVVPKPFNDTDLEVVTRLSNECWKWIPDMRCGYAAKALIVLSELDVSDKRTIRSLIRHIPRSLGKLHQPLAAESIVASARVGYDPRIRYGKRYGSVLYRRLAGKLVSSPQHGQVSPLASVSPDLMVQVVEALASVKRPQNELFDFVVFDISKNPDRYSLDHLVALERVFRDSHRFGRSRNVISKLLNARKGETIIIHNLAFLAREDLDLVPSVLNDSSKLQLKVSDLVPLLRNTDVMEFVLSDWLDMNLADLSRSDLVTLCTGLAENQQNSPTPVPVKVLVDRAVRMDCKSSPDLVVSLIASLTVLNNFDAGIIPSSLFDCACGHPINSLETLRLCQLIGAIIRVRTPAEMSEGLVRFVRWIEEHSISRFAPVEDSGEHRQFYKPNGAVTDLSVFPVVVPLALPDPRIDLRKLHHARSSTSVRRLLANTDPGIALVLPRTSGLAEILSNEYLRILGWSVKPLSRDLDITCPSIVTHALLQTS